MISILSNSNRNLNSKSEYLPHFTKDISFRVNRFHKTISGYKPTPLISVTDRPGGFKVDKLWLKDESKRLGLNAFKVLGASYAITNFIYDQLGLEKTNLSFERLLDEDLSDYIFVTATDGNHGRAVAWTAKQLGCKSYIFMPEGTVPARENNIDQFSTETIVVDGNYDYAVAKAKEFAEKKSTVLIQDTAWKGYEKIPLFIMQGYLTLIKEISEQLDDENFSHIFLHCGVGSMASAIEAYLVNKFGKDKPRTIIVEPSNADCFFQSIKVGDGKRHSIDGKLDSIMAGLSCGTPSTIAWDIISKHSDYFISCDDEITKIGMKELAKNGIVSGESGAVSYGILEYAAANDQSIFNKLGISENSKIMLISTEGNTDPEIYNSIVNEK